MARNELEAVAAQFTPVCAIGASAGGVQALREFFRHVPDDLGIAYVVIIHLAPDHPSSLSQILGGVTRMDVQQVSEQGLRLTQNCVYVIPPDREVVIDGDDVRARPFTEPRGQRAPIDMFFRSVAAGRGDGLAVVLSGSGSDGAMGVRAVKEAGGVVFVQEPAEAEYPMMPRSALATGDADFVAPIPRLVERMIEVSHSKEVVRQLRPGDADADLRRIVAFLRARTGHDFSSYKRATVLRRIARRMQVTRRPDMGSYAEYLVTNPEEAQELFGDLLISVTHFFRDPEAYRVLAEQAIGPLIGDAEEGGIRAWVVGCATGEEAYSLAILMLEEAARRRRTVPIQIFGTDLDEGALGTAREARYPASIEADVSEERLNRWFTREGPHYRIKKEVRDCVLFATHSVLKDPPFMHLDLISCRNLLIYLERELQRQVCTLLHYGLKPHGLLFLGSAETVEMTPDAFFPIHREARLYRARPISRRSLPILTNLPPGHRPDVLVERHRRNSPKQRQEPEVEQGAGASHASALEATAPPSALVDHEYRILHLSAAAGRFLLATAGPFSADISALVRPELRLDLRAGLRRALEHAETTLSMPLPIQLDGSRRRVLLQISPVRNDDDSPPYRALVFFLDGGPVAEVEDIAESESSAEEVRRLRAEVRGLEERLIASRQEHESGIQDLRVTNEELQSVNEEYRSTAEELETSKEELQSLNEELQTVNAELKSKLESISSAHSDLRNLVASTEIGTLFLDANLRIKLFTPAITEHFSVTEADIGRPISDFTHRLDSEGIEEDARGVLRTLAPFVREVATSDGRWLMMRMRPYRTVDERINGVVVTFLDITVRREAERRLRESEERLRKVMETEAVGVLFFEDSGTLVDANDAFLQMSGYTRRQIDERALSRQGLTPPEWSDKSREEMEILERTGRIGPYEKEYLLADGSRRWILFAGRRIEPNLIAEYAIDISDRKRVEEERETLTRELSHRVKNTLAVVQALARRTDGRTVDEFRAAFTGRLNALSQAHAMLLADNWRSADLGELVGRAMAPYGVDESGRVRIEGERAEVSAQQALSLSLVLHELGTNALKYGALSTPQGSVRIAWAKVDEAGTPSLRFTWEERGGPPVVPPTDDGFGSQLILRAAEYDLAGRAQMEWAPEGLTCALTFPAE
jgi:two-component system, chemotaxis family, CheB/CheR fusion protein